MDLADYHNIVVLTGAGISHSAGLPTYRGPGGLWSDPKLAELSDASAGDVLEVMAGLQS